VAARFNDAVVERLVAGALDGLLRHGVASEDVRVTRVPGAPSRRELAERWSRATGIGIERLDYYLCFAFWRLAAIVEGASPCSTHFTRSSNAAWYCAALRP
jgi:aminoglycoside phosphotransferase (APT) family kinase protein